MLILYKALVGKLSERDKRPEQRQTVDVFVVADLYEIASKMVEEGCAVDEELVTMSKFSERIIVDEESLLRINQI